MEKKENLNVVLEVKASNYENGKLKNVFGGKAQITKEDDGRTEQNDEDTVIIRTSDCGTPKMEADYQSVSIGKGEVKTNIELELNGKTADAKGGLIDAIAASAKLTKADAGRELDKAIEDLLVLKAERACDSGCANVETTYTTKTHEIAE
ncbi:MAG: hypothetical protein Q7W45_08695 [Bacteroidota bacterium]|nr:hypothetical protein [Bacteroidota bacterium]MDP3144245.1 hypothetical protein [Bacteroidota bacterium]